MGYNEGRNEKNFSARPPKPFVKVKLHYGQGPRIEKDFDGPRHIILNNLSNFSMDNLISPLKNAFLDEGDPGLEQTMVEYDRSVRYDHPIRGLVSETEDIQLRMIDVAHAIIVQQMIGFCVQYRNIHNVDNVIIHIKSVEKICPELIRTLLGMPNSEVELINHTAEDIHFEKVIQRIFTRRNNDDREEYTGGKREERPFIRGGQYGGNSFPKVEKPVRTPPGSGKKHQKTSPKARNNFGATTNAFEGLDVLLASKEDEAPDDLKEAGVVVVEIPEVTTPKSEVTKDNKGQDSIKEVKKSKPSRSTNSSEDGVTDSSLDTKEEPPVKKPRAPRKPKEKLSSES